jgi:hypothetical protein
LIIFLETLKTPPALSPSPALCALGGSILCMFCSYNLFWCWTKFIHFFILFFVFIGIPMPPTLSPAIWGFACVVYNCLISLWNSDSCNHVFLLLGCLWSDGERAGGL